MAKELKFIKQLEFENEDQTEVKADVEKAGFTKEDLDKIGIYAALTGLFYNHEDHPLWSDEREIKVSGEILNKLFNTLAPYLPGGGLVAIMDSEVSTAVFRSSAMLHGAALLLEKAYEQITDLEDTIGDLNAHISDLEQVEHEANAH